MSSSDHQLFIGRLPRGSRSRDLEDVFYKYGKMTRCDVKQGIKMAYGFIEYEDKRDAQDALKAEHGRDFMGARIVVEWARGPKDPAAPPGPREYRGRERYRDDDDRRDDRYNRHGRSRSPDRDHRRRRSHSRSPDHHRRRSHSRSPDRHRSYSRSPDRERRSRS